MHRSKLAGFLIDCQTGDVEAAADFWSAALGLARLHEPDTESPYRSLENAPGNLYVSVQKVAHPSRVHMDIESDDLEAEASRLEALGARRVGPVKGWIVMEAPTGQRFCIVRAQSPDFEATAHRWN